MRQICLLWKKELTMVMDPTLPRISVRDLLMQAFLTGWELADKAV